MGPAQSSYRAVLQSSRQSLPLREAQGILQLRPRDMGSFSHVDGASALHIPVFRDPVDHRYAVLCPQTAEDDRVLLDVNGTCTDIAVNGTLPQSSWWRNPGELRFRLRTCGNHERDLHLFLFFREQVVKDPFQLFSFSTTSAGSLSR